MRELCILFLAFIIYALIGRISETIVISIEKKKLILNRGYLISPIIPIYGFGAIFMVLILSDYRYEGFVIFASSMVICGVLEYFTSFLLEKIFNIRWWDYSNYKYNINGRIYLLNLLLFGISGVFVINLLNPIIMEFLNNLSTNFIYITSIILFIVLITDFTISTIAAFNLRNKLIPLLKKDRTKDHITAKLELINNTFLIKRLRNSFPHINKIIKSTKK